MDFLNASLFLALLTTALMAGLFYNWSFAIIPGLGQLPDAGYLAAMQAFNRSIQNALFFLIFLGAVVFLIASSLLHFFAAVDVQFALVLSATLLYLLGVMVVTIVGNVPMNNRLDVLDLENLPAAEQQEARQSYEGRWNRLNLIRTFSSLAATVLLILAVMWS